MADTLGIDKMAVIGLSGGGPYTLGCAAAMPDRVVAVGVLGGVAPTVGVDAIGGFLNYVPRHLPNLKNYPELATDLAAGTIPPVVFVDPAFGTGMAEENDEHPPSNPQLGQHFVWEVMRDRSPYAATPALGYASIVISTCVLIFLGLIGFIFWLGGLAEKPVIEQEIKAKPQRELVAATGD